MMVSYSSDCAKKAVLVKDKTAKAEPYSKPQQYIEVLSRKGERREERGVFNSTCRCLCKFSVHVHIVELEIVDNFNNTKMIVLG